jgi:hypothetical protein
MDSDLKPSRFDWIGFCRTHLVGWALVCLSLSSSAVDANDIKGDKTMQTENPLEVTVQVAEEDGMLIARTRFENRSDKPVYVMRGLNGYGKRVARDDGTPDGLMDPEFFIMCNGESVRYVGPHTKWSAPRIVDFDAIHPGEVINTRRVRIDNSYSFKAGALVCELVHHHLQFDVDSNRAFSAPSRPARFTYFPQ